MQKNHFLLLKHFKNTESESEVIYMKLGRVRHNFVFECEAIDATQFRFAQPASLLLYLAFSNIQSSMPV